MTITEYRAWLKGQGIEVDESTSQKMFDERQKAVEAETEKGKEFTRKKDKENLALKELIKESGFDADKDGTLADYLKSIKATRQEKDSILDANKTDLQKLQDRLATMEAAATEKEAAERRSTAEANENKATATLTDKLTGKLHSSKAIIFQAVKEGRAKVVNGEVVGIVDGLEVSVDKLVDNIMENNKESVIITQNGGSGGAGGAPVSGGVSSFNENMTVQEASANIENIKAEIAAMQ